MALEGVTRDEALRIESGSLVITGEGWWNVSSCDSEGHFASVPRPTNLVSKFHLKITCIQSYG